MLRSLALIIFSAFCFNSCAKVKGIEQNYATKNVVVIVVDGPRYSETWGDPSHEFIPHMANDLAPQGVVFTNFYNNGSTYTNSGHASILTGNYQNVNNGMGEAPENPNFLQCWLKESGAYRNKAWLFASKDKIEPLSNCEHPNWKDQFLPSTDCGINGAGSAYRYDSVTVQHVIDTMEMYHPNLVLINLRQPDYAGHYWGWENYLNAIQQVDEDCFVLWEFLQNSPVYKGSTTVFITNDHGRHLDSEGGFASHGDGCEGCRHINLFAAGPDFKKNVINHSEYEQLDISATIAALMGFTMPTSKGKLIKDLFVE